MKKRVLVLFLLVFVIINGQSVVEKIELKRQSAVFYFSGNKLPEKLITYSKKSKIIFIEFSYTKPGSKIKNSFRINGNYIEYINMTRFDTNTDFFIKLNPNIDFKEEILYNPTRYVLKFSKKKKKELSILIDPGHGGKDPGAVGYMGLKEKDVVFNISKSLKRHLENDYNVTMTRYFDKFISLGQRAEMSNKADVDLFISIHANSHNNSSANGAEVFYYSKTASDYAKEIADFENKVDEKYNVSSDYTEFIVDDIIYHLSKERSIRIASDVLDEMCEAADLNKRDIYGANFAVLRGSHSPAILVETGFVSNKRDADKLNDPVYQNKIAKAIADAIKLNLK